MNALPAFRARPAQLLASAALLLALGLAGCKTTQSDAPATSAMAAVPRDEADARDAAAAWGERHRANPTDPVAAINYGQALRASGQRSQAVAVLEQAALKDPKNMEVLGAYGRALADAGNYQQALDVLNQAHTPDRPNWRMLNVQGAVLDQMAAMRKRGATTRPRSRSCRTRPRCSPISVCPMRCPRIWCGPR